MKTKPQPQRLRDLPLWRLLVALADAERAFGPAHETTRNFAQAVQERLSEPGVEDERVAGRVSRTELAAT